jgi:peroxiredoxin Q/BCP
MKKVTMFFATMIITSTCYLLANRVTPLSEGDQAPDFSLQDEQGNWRTLSEFRGRKVVLYFYPKNDTPGCTKQACSLRDSFEDFKKNKITVLGISYDSVESNKAFKHKYLLPFILLADVDKAVAEKYGAIRDWILFTAPIPKRITFIIDEQGKILKVMRHIDVANHASDILKFLS